MLVIQLMNIKFNTFIKDIATHFEIIILNIKSLNFFS